MDYATSCVQPGLDYCESMFDGDLLPADNACGDTIMRLSKNTTLKANWCSLSWSCCWYLPTWTVRKSSWLNYRRHKQSLWPVLETMACKNLSDCSVLVDRQSQKDRIELTPKKFRYCYFWMTRWMHDIVGQAWPSARAQIKYTRELWVRSIYKIGSMLNTGWSSTRCSWIWHGQITAL